jgi:hypothetical protein
MKKIIIFLQRTEEVLKFSLSIILPILVLEMIILIVFDILDSELVLRFIAPVCGLTMILSGITAIICLAAIFIRNLSNAIKDLFN